jgi:polyhydroxybutyrate depolymerase
MPPRRVGVLEGSRVVSISLLGIPHDDDSSFMKGPSEAPPLIRRELSCDAYSLWGEHPRFELSTPVYVSLDWIDWIKEIAGMMVIRWLTCLMFLTLAMTTNAFAAAAEGCDAEMRAGVNHITVLSGGQEQSIDLVLPASFKPSARVPLVIGLHPSGGTGEGLDRDTGLRAAAAAKGFAVILPDGGIQLPRAQGGDGHYWNIPGVPLVGGNAVPSGARDDVRFIADVVDHVAKHNCVDARRVYVTGMSGGARMSSMVGCRLADRVAAVAPVAGLRAGRAAGAEFAEPDAADCRPSRPLAVLAVHGTDDQTNPFPGGGGLRWGYSVERAVSRWASLDVCGAAPSIEKVSAHVTRVRYGRCGGGSEVVLYRIDAPRDQGGGHVWPGGRADLATRAQAPSGSSASAANGPPAVELDATRVVLEFFARH